MRVERIRNKNNSKNNIEDYNVVRNEILAYKGKKGSAIPVLQTIQNAYGYLPKNILKSTANELGISLSDMCGVATFYAQFRFEPVGKHIIKVCHGTACHVQNAIRITLILEELLGIKDGETTEDGLFTLESVACLGCCSLAPVMMIDNNTYGKLTANVCTKIIKEIKEKENMKV